MYADLLRCIIGNPFRPVVTERAYQTIALSRAYVMAAVHAEPFPDDQPEKQVYRERVQRYVLRREWLTPTVRSLAQAAYEGPSNPCPVSFEHLPHDSCDGSAARERLPDGTLRSHRLLVLADALEEAGCVNAQVRQHLREPGPHAKGCWAVDLLRSV
jgi:3',5'-cyclic AMP phosphodiesterase CpdA